jgi:hypothetical protein
VNKKIKINTNPNGPKVQAPRVGVRVQMRINNKFRHRDRIRNKGSELEKISISYLPRASLIKGNNSPTRKLHAQLTIQAILIAVATYFASNISATG